MLPATCAPIFDHLDTALAVAQIGKEPLTSNSLFVGKRQILAWIMFEGLIEG
jgi:hypothetical protein